MEQRDAACCSGGCWPLGAAERSPQDFTLFLINYCYDLSANVGEAATLDNTCNTNAPSAQRPAPPARFKCSVCARTCEEFAIFLLDLLCIFKLLLGMFLRHFIPQINRIFLLPGRTKKGGNSLEILIGNGWFGGRLNVHKGSQSEDGCCLLDLLGVFVADKNDDGVNVNAVESLDGVRADVEQTVAALD